MKAAELFVKCIENEGVTHIFGLAGEENLSLLEAIRNSHIKYIQTRHEQAAGFMAATYGRLTGKPGVTLTTLGPGATNLVTAIAYSKLGAMPMVAITGQKPIKKNLQGNFQIVDVIGMMKPITKSAVQISYANRIPSMVREAFRLSGEERLGPTHIELPKDIAVEETDGKPFEINQVRRPIAEYKAIDRAVEIIEKAKFPLILIGAGANRKLTSKMLTEFINKTGIPFFNTQMGKGVVDERHELFLGTAVLLANDYIHCAIDRADLIINVGHDIIEKPPFIMQHNNGQKVIHMNFFGAEVNEIYFPQLEVVGDIANAIWQIKEKITKQKHWDFSYFMRVKEDIEQKVYAELKENSFPVPPQKLVSVIRNAIGEKDIVTLDNGMFKLWFARNYKAYNPNTLLLDNALATMGAGLPSAITAKLVSPEKKVIAVCGDGGFMMNSQELETAMRLDLDLVIVIINDSGFGMIKWEQEEKGYGEFGLDHKNPDFVKYAESYGATGTRITKTEDLDKVFKKALSEKGVYVIEVPVDYSYNRKVFSEELENKMCIV